MLERSIDSLEIFVISAQFFWLSSLLLSFNQRLTKLFSLFHLLKVFPKITFKKSNSMNQRRPFQFLFLILRLFLPVEMNLSDIIYSLLQFLASFVLVLNGGLQ